LVRNSVMVIFRAQR